MIASRRRVFATGFIVVFVGMLLFSSKNIYNGRGVVKGVLWQYYYQFAPQMVMYHPLGPGTMKFRDVLEILLFHVCVSLLVGWLLSLFWQNFRRKVGHLPERVEP